MTTPDTKTVTYSDDKDWLPAGVALIFLIIFPIVIVLIWREPRDVAPLYFVIPFTLIFVLGAPFLLRMVTSARTRKFALRLDSGFLEIIERTAFSTQRQTLKAHDVAHVEFNTHDDDGFWYTASIVLADGRKYAFAQGNHRPDVRGKFDDFLEHLQKLNPAITATETQN